MSNGTTCHPLAHLFQKLEGFLNSKNKHVNLHKNYTFIFTWIHWITEPGNFYIKICICICFNNNNTKLIFIFRENIQNYRKNQKNKQKEVQHIIYLFF